MKTIAQYLLHSHELVVTESPSPAGWFLDYRHKKKLPSFLLLLPPHELICADVSSAMNPTIHNKLMGGKKKKVRDVVIVDVQT